jgi:predicted RNase H-like HicB family nuclease
MIVEFIDKKMKTARYKILEDRTFFGEIPRIKGVWANAPDLEACRTQLREVLEDWLLLKVHDHEDVPGFKVNFDRRRLVQDA